MARRRSYTLLHKALPTGLRNFLFITVLIVSIAGIAKQLEKRGPVTFTQSKAAVCCQGGTCANGSTYNGDDNAQTYNDCGARAVDACRNLGSEPESGGGPCEGTGGGGGSESNSGNVPPPGGGGSGGETGSVPQSGGGGNQCGNCKGSCSPNGRYCEQKTSQCAASGKWITEVFICAGGKYPSQSNYPQAGGTCYTGSCSSGNGSGQPPSGAGSGNGTESTPPSSGTQTSGPTNSNCVPRKGAVCSTWGKSGDFACLTMNPPVCVQCRDGCAYYTGLENCAGKKCNPKAPVNPPGSGSGDNGSNGSSPSSDLGICPSNRSCSSQIIDQQPMPLKCRNSSGVLWACCIEGQIMKEGICTPDGSNGPTFDPNGKFCRELYNQWCQNNQKITGLPVNLSECDPKALIYCKPAGSGSTDSSGQQGKLADGKNTRCCTPTVQGSLNKGPQCVEWFRNEFQQFNRITYDCRVTNTSKERCISKNECVEVLDIANKPELVICGTGDFNDFPFCSGTRFDNSNCKSLQGAYRRSCFRGGTVSSSTIGDRCCKTEKDPGPDTDPDKMKKSAPPPTRTCSVKRVDGQTVTIKPGESVCSTRTQAAFCNEAEGTKFTECPRTLGNRLGICTQVTGTSTDCKPGKLVIGSATGCCDPGFGNSCAGYYPDASIPYTCTKKDDDCEGNFRCIPETLNTSSQDEIEVLADTCLFGSCNPDGMVTCPQLFKDPKKYNCPAGKRCVTYWGGAGLSKMFRAGCEWIPLGLRRE